ncbi:STP1 [Lachancea thermotolerans]
MPYVSLLKPSQNKILVSIAEKVKEFFRNLADFVVAGDGNSKDAKKDVEEGINEAEEVKNSPEKSRSLFPAQNNVDKSLELAPTIVPCALDLSTLQSPISMTKTPEGHLDWQLMAPSMTGDAAGPNGPPSFAPTLNSPESIECKTEDDEHGCSDKDQKRFVCHYCNAKFYIRGYLTRHIKKHAVEKAYYCPYFNADAPKDQRCHTTGGFSRRDTYKTHLRSRHFICPKGVRSQEKAKSSGRCAHCNEQFDKTDDWIKSHVEAGECKGLPDGFKVAVKSSRKTGKLKMIKTSNGHSRFISTQQCVIEPSVMHNKEALEATAIVIDQSKNNGNPLESTVLTTNDNKIMLNSEHFQGASKTKKNNKVSPKKPEVASLDGPQDSFFNYPNGQASLGTAQPHLQSYPFNQVTPVKETSLDEGCLSMDPSPTEDAGLEAVNSSSSASSRVSFHDHNVKDNQASSMPYPNAHDDFFQFPLDIDQCPMNPMYYERPVQSHNEGLASEGSQINETLNKQMDAVVLSERHFRENQQYLNFYNYTFDSHL